MVTSQTKLQCSFVALHTAGDRVEFFEGLVGTVGVLNTHHGDLDRLADGLAEGSLGKFEKEFNRLP